MPISPLHKEIVKLALGEDLLPSGDLSSLILPESQRIYTAQIIAKEAGVMVCGEIVNLVLEERLKISGSLEELDHHANFESQIFFENGKPFKDGDILVEIQAPLWLLLSTERTILNFLQRLSGIGVYTQKLLSLIKDYNCVLLDTRKTSPGMRVWQKDAFRQAGGTNHRLSLSDMVMLKENHIRGCKDLNAEIKRVREFLDSNALHESKIEVEINKDNLAKLDSVLESPVDIIMLDNFDVSEIVSLVSRVHAKNLQVEISGGINETNILSYAQTGVDFISSSRPFTHSSSVDLSMLIK